MTRRFSGFQPTGSLHLGNYLGAIRPTIAGQYDTETMVAVVDLHAMTVEHDPASLARRTLELATLLLAAGLDPAHCTLFIQSEVREHTELHYLLECVTSYGEAHRMIQFREKADAQQQVRLSLLTYPVLMAADVLLYGIEEVPVGEDQRQHVGLARDVATRFNGRYGETFVLPRACHPGVAARVMDLSDPTVKMGKTNANSAGVLRLMDPPDVLLRAVLRAVTDTRGQVCYDRQAQPGITNLLDILAACTGGSPAALAGSFSSYGALKTAVADAVVCLLRPIQARYRELAADPAAVRAVLSDGADRARAQAATTVSRVRAAIGLTA